MARAWSLDIPDCLILNLVCSGGFTPAMFAQPVVRMVTRVTPKHRVIPHRASHIGSLLALFGIDYRQTLCPAIINILSIVLISDV